MRKSISKETISPEVLIAYSQPAEKFVDRDDQCCVEIGRGENSDEFNYELVDISSVDLRSWLDPSLSQARRSSQNTGSASQKLLRLCICPLNIDLKAKLPPSWDNIWQELKFLDLKDSYLFEERLQVPPSWFEVTLNGDLKGFIIKPEKWDANLANFSLCLIFSPSTGITCALLHILLVMSSKARAAKPGARTNRA